MLLARFAQLFQYLDEIWLLFHNASELCCHYLFLEIDKKNLCQKYDFGSKRQP